MRTLQEGIYYDCSDCTGPFFSILFLRASPEAEPARIGATLGRLWSMYQGLKNGQVEDLPDHPVAPGDLQVLVAYGTRVLQRPGARQQLPDALRTYGFPHHDVVADAPVLANSGLAYASDVGENVAEADVAVQLTGTTQIAVYRAVVETWKCLHDLALESAPVLELAAFYSGHQRDDRRSWIDFHDGINNLPKPERERVIAIKPGQDAGWTVGGTYLAYLRIAVDLAAWRRLSRIQQEHIVGRDKLTGAPLLQGGEPAPGCPVTGTTDVLQKGNEDFRAQRFPDPFAHSHIQRANANRRQYPRFATSSRIFRQGFEFLETLDRPPYFQAGLNFVSFQDSPERLHSILTRDGWLGGTNFGGDPASAPAGSWLLSVRAAGMFIVPPVVEAEGFPGSSIFG